MEDNKIKIEKIYHFMMDKITAIYDVFKDTFSEDNVDLQTITLERFKHDFNFSNLILDSDVFRDIDYENRLDASSKSFYSSSAEIKNLILDYLINPDNQDKLENVLLGIPSFRSTIIIYYPKVRVTNENGEFTDITDVYIKVLINPNGLLNGRFKLSRGSYTLDELKHDYMHSHVNGIPFDNFSEFKSFCTGSGPINRTISTLSIHYNIDIWGLFCTELDDLIHIESIEGIPYRFLSSIHKNGAYLEYGKYNVCIYQGNLQDSLFKDFFNWYLKNNNLNFIFVNNQYLLNISYTDYLLEITKNFIDWINETNNYNISTSKLLTDDYLFEGFIKNDKVYSSTRFPDNDDYLEYEGSSICDFKGRHIELKIIKEANFKYNKMLLFNINYSLVFLNKILQIINYNYGREERTKEIKADQTVIYL